MSEIRPETSLPLEQPPRRPARAGGRRKRRRVSGCIPVLLVLAVVAGILYFGAMWGKNFIEEQFGDPEDYPGPGKGSVTFEIHEGDTIAQMGRNLEEAGVVASADAFTAAASGHPDARGIQVGFYSLKREMRAADVLDILTDPAQILTTRVTVPEGLRVEAIVDRLVENTDFKRRQFEKALKKSEKLGLPEYADGDAEGYLFPATYGFGPQATPTTMLRAMVDRWKQAAEEADVEGAAERLGYTPHELMTVASLVEAEGRGDDMPKVARVIYNRLENPGTAGTTGLLQIDAAVNYALGREPIAHLTTAQIQSVADSPYNTYTQEGLPPGPIEAPGDAAIEAAAQPAEGDWYYYVTVNLETGETKFAETPEEFARYKAEFREYCATQSDRC
jgi:UPF0755 protein